MILTSLVCLSELQNWFNELFTLWVRRFVPFLFKCSLLIFRPDSLMLGFSIKLNPLPSRYLFNFILASFCSSSRSFSFRQITVEKQILIFSKSSISRTTFISFLLFHCLNTISEVICTSMNYHSIRFSPCSWIDVMVVDPGCDIIFTLPSLEDDSSRRRYIINESQATIILVYYHH